MVIELFPDITYRATQNPDTPDLPFSQEYPIHTQADIPINFGQTVLGLASLTKGRRTYYDYILNGDHWTFGKMVNKKLRLTESNAQQYRSKGYSVVKVKDTGGILKPKPPTPITPTSGNYDTDIARLYKIHKEQEGRITDAYKHRLGIETKLLALQNRPSGGGFTKPQIETILKDYYADDISRLDRIHKEQEDRITSGFKHRLNIEEKVNKAKGEHQNIWDSIGQKSDISHLHDNGNDNGSDWCDCGFWDIGCKSKCVINDQGSSIIGGSLATLAVVGIGAYLLLRRKK